MSGNCWIWPRNAENMAVREPIEKIGRGDIVQVAPPGPGPPGGMGKNPISDNLYSQGRIQGAGG